MNIRFHQAIIGLSKSRLLATMTETLFIHMRSIRARTIGENNRVQRSIIDISLDGIVFHCCEQCSQTGDFLIRRVFGD